MLYKNALLKISGEILSGDSSKTFDVDIIKQLTHDIKLFSKKKSNSLLSLVVEILSVELIIVSII